MGDSDAMEVGEWVLAIGSPFGLTGTVTSGIVSAKGRDGMGITDYENFLQTDAAINPGNSGGPLVNLQGQAVGINTAIVSRSGGYNGIGFAIPMNMAKQICEQLMEHGSVTRGYLGVMIQALTPELAKSFGLGDVTGVLIGDVSSDGPAAGAGLQRGDVIVSFNGEPVKDTTSFRSRVAMIKPDTSVNLEVLREGQHKSFSLQVGKLPDSESVTGNGKESVESSWGLSVQTLNQQLAEQLGVDVTQWCRRHRCGSRLLWRPPRVSDRAWSSRRSTASRSATPRNLTKRSRPARTPTRSCCSSRREVTRSTWCCRKRTRGSRHMSGGSTGPPIQLL